MKKAKSVFRNPNPVFDRKQIGSETISLPVIRQARKSGQLNLSNRGFVELPDVVCQVNSLSLEESKMLSLSMDSSDDDRWWDQVELTKLILASNCLHSIPPAIEGLRFLTVLDLHDNQLTTLPSALQELQKLFKLNLSHNKFEEIPSSVFRLKSLQYFYAQHNGIKLLDDNIGDLNLLEELDLSHNQLMVLPHTIGYLTRVRKFNLNNNKLESLPGEIGCMLGLLSLELSNNCLKDLPTDLSCLEHLVTLYSQNNKLSHLPVLTSCINLKELHLGFNAIIEITSEHLEALPQICILDLRDNKLTSIPDQITLLFGLERLDLTNNSLTTLPYTLGTMPHLKSLQIEGNSLKHIRRDIIMRGTVQLLRWLRSRITDDPSLPPTSADRRSHSSSGNLRPDASLKEIDVYTMKSTRTFDYSNLRAMLIPSELFSKANDANVTVVNFSKNCLSEVPNQLETLMPKLSELHLGFNKIASVPSFLGIGASLSYLDLRNNQISELPDELENLERIREINLSFNRFKKFPSVLYEMSKLEIIFLNENQIEELDVDGLARLKILATLNLTNNDIIRIPPELGRLEQLRSLQLDGNAFRNPRAAVLAKGTASLLQYLRDRIST